MELDILRGVYPADRASALAGVPRSTLYYWARHDVWEPSLRGTRPKLWTYADVLAVRIIYWLRSVKDRDPEARSSMPEVRTALATIRSEGAEIWHTDVRVFVDREGHVFFSAPSGTWRAGKPGQAVMPAVLDVLSEFPTGPGRTGPDLQRPRPHLRIIPGKLGGEPHVEATRISTRTVAALIRDGLDDRQVLRLYGDLTAESVAECWDLEKQLQANLAA